MIIGALACACTLQPPPPTGPGSARSPQPDLKQPVVEVSVETAWKDIAAAYRKSPIAERVMIAIKPPERPARKDEFTIRIDPGTTVAPRGPAGAPGTSHPVDPRPAAVALELGPLRIHASANLITAVSSTNPATILLANYDRPLWPGVFDTLLPPLPAPQLAAAFGDAERLPISLTPYSSRVIWSKALLDPNPTPPILTLTGESAGPLTGGSGGDAKVTLIADARNSRMLRVTISIGTPPTVMDLSMLPVELGDLAEWKPPVADRREVKTLGELVQRPPAPPAEPEKPQEPQPTPPPG